MSRIDHPSAGVGALISAEPRLQPYALELCLGILALLTVVNLRGVRDSGRAFMAPTYLFVICLGGVVILGTLLYAFAFSSIYSRQNSRIAASRWMYQNLPQGSVLANEHWDDWLPIGGLDGYTSYGDQGMFQSVEMRNYEDDTPDKLNEMVNNLTQAVNAYKRAVATDPGFVPAQLALVRAQERNGDIKGALASAQKLVVDLPKSGEAFLLLGRMQLRNKDAAAALPSLEKATQLAPGLTEAWALLGTAAQFVGGKPEVAMNAYKKATELDPGNEDYRTTYGLLLGINKQFDAAVLPEGLDPIPLLAG